jgi:hypothetical protein
LIEGLHDGLAAGEDAPGIVALVMLEDAPLVGAGDALEASLLHAAL